MSAIRCEIQLRIPLKMAKVELNPDEPEPKKIKPRQTNRHLFGVVRRGVLEQLPAPAPLVVALAAAAMSGLCLS